MRSLGSGTSSTRPGFVVDFGWLVFSKHPHEGSNYFAFMPPDQQRNEDDCYQYGVFGCIIGSRRKIII